MVTLEQLVPKDHLLRLLDQPIRFDFIREATAHLYCENNGQPMIDPVVLFKMLFIGYLFGIRSERRLVKEIEVNAAIEADRAAAGKKPLKRDDDDSAPPMKEIESSSARSTPMPASWPATTSRPGSSTSIIEPLMACMP